MNEICLSCRKHTKCGRAKHETIGCGYYVPLTEQEWLQTANTEQLAEFLACVEARQNADYNEETKAWVDWLKQPHTSKE